MPVFSYLAYPTPGAKTALFKELSALDHCEVASARNADVLILVTETPDEQEEANLQMEKDSLTSDEKHLSALDSGKGTKPGQGLCALLRCLCPCFAFGHHYGRRRPLWRTESSRRAL